MTTTDRIAPALSRACDPRSWSTPAKLALVAAILGVVALFGDPYGGGRVSVDERQLAAIVQREVDHVSVTELADWIVAGRSDFRLLDLRSPEAFAAYHIPGAENVPLATLPDYPLGRNETIVLVSDGGIHAAQGWFLLEAKGYAGTKILRDGLDGWKEQVLYPVAATAATPEARAELAKRTSVAAYFGGAPRAAAAAGSDLALPNPALAAPAAAAGAGASPAVPVPTAPVAGPRPAKKAKEGC